VSLPGRRLLLAVVPAVLVLAVLGWLGIRGYAAARHLSRARAEVAQLRTALVDGKSDVAAGKLHDAQAETRQAHRLTADPLWRIVAAIPYAGRTLRTAGGLATAADRLAADALPPLVAAADSLSPDKLRRSAAAIDLQPLVAARGPLADAERRVADVRRDLLRLPASGLLPPVGKGRSQLDSQLGSLLTSVHDAALTARLAPPMLGSDGVRRYFLGFENNAEARGTGGLVGTYGVLEADHGALRLVHVGSDAELPDPDYPLVDLGPDYALRYSEFSPSSLVVNANFSPHFPYAARNYAAIYAKDRGEQVDGVILLDPQALSYLLGATGGLTLPDGTAVNAGNVVALTESTAYARFPDVAKRKAFLVELSRSVFQHIVSGTGSAKGLTSALGRAATEGRLLAASIARPEEQAVLESTRLGGVLPETAQPYAGLVINNQGGTKLDYYLDRSVEYVAGPCGGGSRKSSVTIRLTNDAPATGLPAYVVGRADRPGYPSGGRATVETDRQLVQELGEPFGIGLREPAAALGNGQHVGDFISPQGGDEGLLVGQQIEGSFGRGVGLVFEAPRHHGRGVEDEGHQLRPSPIIWRTVVSPRVRPRRASRRAVMTEGVSALGAWTGTNRATGCPCLVIVSELPAATISSSRGRCVFASYAPTSSI